MNMCGNMITKRTPCDGDGNGLAAPIRKYVHNNVRDHVRKRIHNHARQHVRNGIPIIYIYIYII